MKLIIRIISICLLNILFISSALAHLFAPSLLQIEETKANHFNVVWKTPTTTSTKTQLKPSWPHACQIQTTNQPVVEGTGVVSSWQLNCSVLGNMGLVGQNFSITGLGVNQVSAMLMIKLRDGRHYQQILNGHQPEYTVPEEPKQSAVITEYTVLGAEHIMEGIDHLMFVFGLLLLVGGGTRLLWTITAFTLGHSITLSLVTLGFIKFPVPLVEFTIALSIFMLALHLARSDQKGLFRKHPWWLAGGFGLLHGMGFAGALAEIGLPQSNVPLALLFFNIGIEVGQITFIVVLLSLWWLVKRPLQQWHHKLLPLPVYVLGGLSAMWCIERGLSVVS